MFRRNSKLLVLAALAILTISSGIAYEQISRINALDRFVANGAMVNIGSRKLHIDCRGEGYPTVVLESGLDTYGSLSWSAVHNKLAQKTRTCAYDRAGIMWSDPRTNTNDIMSAVANDLNDALLISEEKPPYIMVGHSYGGPYITKFTELFSEEVARIVFIDSPHPEQMDLVQDIEIPISHVLGNAISEILTPVLDITGVTRLFNASFYYPLPNQPIKDNEVIKAFAPSSFNTLRDEISNYQTGLTQIKGLRDFGDRPLFVLGNIVDYTVMTDQQLTNAGLNRAIVPAVMEQDLYMFNDQASWSSNSKIKLFHNTSHYIQFEKPNEVISAIEFIIWQVKDNQQGAY